MSSRQLRNIILVVTGLLLSLSALMVFSTTAVSAQESMGRSTAMLSKHLIQCILGLCCCFVATRLPTELYRRIAPAVLGVAGLLLVLVALPGVGHTAGGATRWLALGPLRVQPGELVKLAVIIFMAHYIGEKHNEMQLFKHGVVIPLTVVSIFAAVLLTQPDFGSTSIILLVVGMQLLMATRIKHLSMIGGFVACAMALLIIVSPYRFRRVEALFNPSAEGSASSYQLSQSLIAVGSGGLFGEGLGSGKQKLYYLPAAHTDFIFAVIGEELGLVGASAVIILFAAFAFAGTSLAKKLVNDPFRCALAVGLTSLIVVPAFLNMGVVLGLLPTKGLVLPLVAYGGTAMVVNLLAVGILLRLVYEERVGA